MNVAPPGPLLYPFLKSRQCFGEEAVDNVGQDPFSGIKYESCHAILSLKGGGVTYKMFPREDEAMRASSSPRGPPACSL